MLLAATEYVRPDSLEDALAALGTTAGSRALAGGQTLINVLKHRAASVELLVDISRLEELRFIEVSADGSATIGAATTYRELEQSPELRTAQPIIGEVAAGTVDASWSADVQLRGVLRSLLQRGIGSLFNEQVEAVLAAGALLSEGASER